MIAQIKINNRELSIDLSKPLDISIPLSNSEENPEAWYLTPPTIKPVRVHDWVGKVTEGASVNFNSIWFNPHAHGTHTECVGHISSAFHSVNESLKQFFFTAELISVTPEKRGEDYVISLEEVKKQLGDVTPKAVVIRTLPNGEEKLQKKYSYTNWPYLEGKVATFLREIGVEHLLVDLPSIDRESDEGKLEAHREFWDYPKNIRYEATITEFIYVADSIADGSYVLNLQVAPFENDASPSRPVLFKI